MKMTENRIRNVTGLISTAYSMNGVSAIATPASPCSTRATVFSRGV